MLRHVGLRTGSLRMNWQAAPSAACATNSQPRSMAREWGRRFSNWRYPTRSGVRQGGAWLPPCATSRQAVLESRRFTSGLHRPAPLLQDTGHASQHEVLRTLSDGVRIVGRSRAHKSSRERTMQSSFSRRAIRATASVMLGVWFIALGMGMVNACLLNDGHARHGHLDHQRDAFTAAPMTGNRAALADLLTGEVQLVGADDQNPSSAEVTCLHFCAAGQSSVLQQLGDDPVSLATHALPTGWRPSSTPSPYRQSSWLVRGDAAGLHRPDFIRFLRLTI